MGLLTNGSSNMYVEIWHVQMGAVLGQVQADQEGAVDM